MSLVDYASSSSDDEENDAVPGEKLADPQPPNQAGTEQPPPKRDSSPQPPPAPPLTRPVEKLPDVAALLGPSSSAPSLLGKREPAAAAGPTMPRSKVPRGSHLPHPKAVPDTGGGNLLPPQLRGRSNVVTEDIGKLFVRRHAESSN